MQQMADVTTEQLFQEALAHHQAGRAAEAQAGYRRVLEREPAHADALNLLGVIAAQAGRPQEAVDLIARASALRSDVRIHQNLAMALRQSGRLPEALDACRKALAIGETIPLLMQFADALLATGDATNAEQALLRVLAREKDHVPALQQIGMINAKLGYHDRAVEALERAVAIDPRFPGALRQLGDSLFQLGALEPGVDVCRRAVQLFPDDVVSLNHLAMSLQRLGQNEEAVGYFQRVIDVPAKSADEWFNRGLSLSGLHRIPEAEQAYRQALTLDPNSIRAQMNLGVTCGFLGKHSEAMECYEQVLRVAPTFPAARFHRAVSLLRDGRLREGFVEYASRWNAITHQAMRRTFIQPLWAGQELGGKRLLLEREQGLGDMIQCARYATLAARRGARVILEVPPELVSLMRSVEGVEQVAASGQTLPEFDFHAALLDLPLIFGTTLETIPASTPYIRADAEKVDVWAARLAADEPDGRPALRVGLVWAGRPMHSNDRSRSLALTDLAPLARAAADGVSLLSLQKGPAAEQAATPPPGMSLRDYTSDLHDFSDTAALLMNLDLLISVDTSVAHLAGALGMPVWTMIAVGPDWRWLLNRHDSPWYPTMRLFRQSRWNDWGPVIDSVTQALRQRISAPTHRD